MNAIEITGLSKTYKGKKGARVEALKELSLSLEPGEVFGFLGPNGAGKSTTIKVIMGLITPSAGKVQVFGTDVSSHRARLKVGYLPENPAFYDFLNAQEYLALVARTFAVQNADQAIERVLKQMELWEAGKRLIRSYSKGMVQRLGLAQVLVHDPDLLVLDEPMSGLDPLGRALVKDIIVDHKKRGKSVFFSTHITADVESVCDRVGVIVAGKLETVERVETIMRGGIEGYLVQLHEPTQVREVSVSKGELPGLIARAHADGVEIGLIEPIRKDLEDFFLDIVNAKK